MRPYSAADVVSKRGTLVQQCSSSVMARKLFQAPVLSTAEMLYSRDNFEV
jgi:isocitrate lyase